MPEVDCGSLSQRFVNVFLRHVAGNAGRVNQLLVSLNSEIVFGFSCSLSKDSSTLVPKPMD